MATRATRIIAGRGRLFLFLSRRIRTGAIRAARAGAIAQTMLSTPAFARAFTLAHAACRAIGLRTTVGADAAVLFETRSLPCGAFLLRLWWATVTLALAFAALAILCHGSHYRSTQEQSGQDETCEYFIFHNFVFVLLMIVLDASTAPASPTLDHAQINRTRLCRLQFVHVVQNKCEQRL